MRVACSTFMVKYKDVEWPEEMDCRPIIGDWVEGRFVLTNEPVRLRVHAVIHAVYDSENNSRLQVELGA